MMETNEVIQGDCLIESDKIESGSVDLILTDPPYGNMKGAELDGWDNQKTNWDNILAPNDLFNVANIILRKNGKLILFSQEPYTSQLITEAIPNLPFSYRMVWLKDHFANSLIAKKAPVSYIEDVLVFKKTECQYSINPLKGIMKKYVNKYGKKYIIDLFKKEGRYSSKASAKVHASYKFGFNGGKRFDLMDKKLYNFISKYIEFEETYQELKKINNKFKEKYKSTFNLPEGKKYKSNVLEYKKDYDGYHPTQKPVALLEDLIKTYSNEGDLVVDLTAGSGSTGVAAKNLNRNYILIEQEEKYCEIARQRIDKV